MSSNLPPNITEDHPEFNVDHTRMKDCASCMGCGLESSLILFKGEYIKRWLNCPECYGTGKVEMTPEEVLEEIEASKEPKHDL